MAHTTPTEPVPRLSEDLRALPPEVLRKRCDPAALGFGSTEDVTPLDGLLGQERAVEAIRFGAGIRGEGYNLFVLGPEGTGRHTLIRRLLEERALDEPTPSDWCYVNDFSEPRRPRALELPAGRGQQLRRDVDLLIEEVGPALQSALQSEAHRARRVALEGTYKAQRAKAFDEARALARERGVAVVQTPDGMALLPLKEKGREEAAESPGEERERFAEVAKEVHAEIHELLHHLEEMETQAREEVHRLDREVVDATLQALFERLRRRYGDLEAVCRWLDAAQLDMAEHAPELVEHGDGAAEALVAAMQQGIPPPATRRYKVNLFIDRAGLHGAPVVEEDRPAVHNLFGRVEHQVQFGALHTDFTMVRAGALHRANGGYLVVDAVRVLTEPLAWLELKRVLRSRTLRIQSLPEILGWTATESLEPEPIPFDAKVVLVGPRILYYLLGEADPEFHRLFKVAAEVDDRVPATDENEALYARLVAGLVRESHLRPSDAGAVARVVEEARRLTDDAETLSTNLDRVGDLLREADHFANRAGRGVTRREDVEAALEAKRRRLGRAQERMLEEIRRGHVVIETEGARVGQVNGLSYVELGLYAFGRPVRISARVRMGRGEVVDIEREAHLGGQLHSKGVLILTGFLTTRYLTDQPLSLAATLTFEQSYGGVEGDSASLAEVCALLSAIGGVPLPQAIAITGSVDQHGRVQAVGGVNEKIEGFVDVCRDRRPDGPFGVILPRSNEDHLMLREEVVEAAREGWLRVYPVETVDQAMEVLTGMPAGVRDAQGRFPPDTVNHLVQTRLETFAERARPPSPMPLPPLVRAAGPNGHAPTDDRRSKP